MPRETLNIFSIADQNFYPGLAVSLLSCLECASGKYDYHFRVLEDKIGNEQKKELDSKISSLANDINMTAHISWYAVDQNLVNDLPPDRGSRMTYTKFLIPHLLENCDSAIHVDSDFLVNLGVEKLWEECLGSECLIGGVPDFHQTLKNECPVLDLNRAESDSPYLNAGMLWMNLKKLRNINILEQSREFVAKHPNIKHGDQTILNYLCRNKILALPDYYNLCLTLGTGMRVYENGHSMNLHFIGKCKPWFSAPISRQFVAHKMWWAFLKKHQITASEKHSNHNLPLDYHSTKSKIIKNLFNPKRSISYHRDILSIKQFIES